MSSDYFKASCIFLSMLIVYPTILVSFLNLQWFIYWLSCVFQESDYIKQKVFYIFLSNSYTSNSFFFNCAGYYLQNIIKKKLWWTLRLDPDFYVNATSVPH